LIWPRRFLSNPQLPLSLLLAASAGVLYLPLARYPFVQDDWPLLDSFLFRPASATILNILTPVGKLFYRPLGQLYCFAVYSIFGLNPAGFHLLAVLGLLATALFVVHLARQATGDSMLAWGSGILYVGAANVLLDTQMWLVGIFDIGAGMFSVLSVLYALRSRYALSALFFALAIPFKEGAAVILFVLLAWEIIGGRLGASPVVAARLLLDRYRWHAIALAAFILAKTFGIQLYAFANDHPYVMRFAGRHIRDNLQSYLLWGLQAVIPAKNITFSESASLAVLTAACVVVVLIFFGTVRVARKAGADLLPHLRLVLVLAFWFLLSLLPSILLPHHINRYYLTSGLPPLVILSMMALKGAFVSAQANSPLRWLLCVAFVGANVIDGGVMIERRISLGIREGVHASSRDGDNHFIRKATWVSDTWKPLLATLPSIPSHAILVLDGIQSGGFADQFGPRVWYRDSTIQVTNKLPEGPDSTGLYTVTLPQMDPWMEPAKLNIVTVPADRLIVIHYADGKMERIALDTLRNVPSSGFGSSTGSPR